MEAQLTRSLKRLLPQSRPAIAASLAKAAQVLILQRECSSLATRSRVVHSRSSGCYGRYGSGRPAPGLAVVALAGVSAIATTAAALCESLQEFEDSTGSSPPSFQGPEVSAGFEDAFEMRNLLGAGAFGVVMLCRDKATGDEFAVKIVQDLPSYAAEVGREQDALARIEQSGGHPNIVAYDRSYCENGFHYLVMENVGGDSLFSFMKKRHALATPDALQLVAQLAHALVFMSNIDLIHRDLKPENIMVTVPASSEQQQDVTSTEPSDIVLKIIDFGSAGRASRPDTSQASRPVVLSGTRTYWSPEVLEQQSVTAAMDAWALGCILYIMLSGRHPFDLMGCSSEEQILQRIVSDQVSFLLPEWDSVPEQVKDIVRGLLEKDPAQRMTPQDLLSHPAVIAVTSNNDTSDA